MSEKRIHLNYGPSLTIPPGTEVGVFTDAACTVAASIYANDGVTPTANPVIVDANGEFSYRAANGVYWEKIGAEPAVELRFYEPPTGTDKIAYNFAGDLVVSTGKVPRPIPQAITITSGQIEVTTAGVTGQTVIEFRNGATLVCTATIASGATTGTLALNNPVLAAGSVLKANIIAATTTAAKDLGIILIAERT